MIVQTEKMEQFGTALLRCTKCGKTFTRSMIEPRIIVCPQCNAVENSLEIAASFEAEQRIKNMTHVSDTPA